MPNSAAPLYVRIQETLRAQIASGRLGVGAKLPSESELAESFATTRMTVRQALAQLTFEGLIVRRMGSGTYVADRPVEGRIETLRIQSFEAQVEAAGEHVAFRLIGFDAEPADAATAESLGVDPGTIVYRLRRQRLVKGEVIGFEDRRMLARIGAAVSAAALATESAVSMVERALGAPLGGMSVSVGAVPAKGDIAKRLGLPRDAPVLLRTHTFFDQAGRAVLTGESAYRGDKYRFIYRFGRAGT
jgi:GntR family transcriptional regulator